MKALNPSTGNLEEIYVKALDSLPVGSQIEFSGTDIPAGWEEVNDYSTTEIDTGKTWINGKHIYSTTFEVSTFNSAVNHNISNIDEIINAIPKIKKTTGSFITDNYYLNNNDYACVIASTIAYTFFVSATPSKAYVVLEYTKSS